MNISNFERRNMKEDFIAQMQKKVAVSAVGASAVRGQPKGTIEVARGHLARIALGHVPRRDALRFAEWLDRRTEEMTFGAQARAVPWGVARKCLNLFLRDAFYNRYLHEEYNLAPIERMLEVPLDGVVGRFLIRARKDGSLKSWPGLKRLTPEHSTQFQKVAARIADAEGIPRVHLDIFVWTDNR
jgi:hypothetical protein